MTDAGKGVIDIDGDFDAFERSRRQAMSNFSRDVNGKLRNAKGQFVKEGGAAGQGYGSAASRSFGTSFGSGITGSIRGVASSMTTMLVGAASAAAAGIGVAMGAAGGWGLKLAADNETAAIGFETLLGSSEAAGAYLKELQGFAAKTPFEFPELRNAASRFIAVGTSAEDVIPIMETLGDSTAAMGTGAQGIDRATTALTQMQQKGKVTGEEMLQLAEAGIPAWDALAAQMGTSVPEAQKKVSAGLVEAGTLFEALENKAGPALQRTTGMMEKQATTLTGMLSTLKDTVGQNLAEGMAPAVEQIKGLLPVLTEVGGAMSDTLGAGFANVLKPITGLLDSISGPLESIVSSVTSGLGPLIDGLASGIAAAAPGIASFMDAFSGLGTVLGPVAEVLGGLLGTALEALAPVLAAVLDAVRPLVPILGDALLSALDALAPLFPVLADAVQELAPLLAELGKAVGAELVELLQELVPIMLENAPAAMDMAKAVLELTIALLPIIGPLGKLIGLISRLNGLEMAVLAKVIGLVADALGAVTGFDFAGAWGKITGAISGFARTVGSVIPKVVGFFTRLPGQIIRAVATFATVLVPKGLALIGGLVLGLVGALPRVLGFMLALPLVILKAIGSLTGYLVPKGLELLAGMLTGLWNALPGVLGFLAGLPGRALSAVGNLASTLIPKAMSFIGGFLIGMIRKIPAVMSWITGLPGRLVSAVGDLGSKLLGAGRKLVEGLWNGIKNAGKWIKDKIGGFVGGVVGGFTGALGIGTASTVMAEMVGRPMAEGVALGWEQNVPALSVPGVSPGRLGLRGSTAAVTSARSSSAAVGASGARQEVNIGELHLHDGVDQDRFLFELGFKLAG